ncbi:MAG: hypothetical protein CMM07_00955 [Rhodopirellula sp.]|nr:hypothetical protein [Rhodopirellula sp.]
MHEAERVAEQAWVVGPTGKRVVVSWCSPWCADTGERIEASFIVECRDGKVAGTQFYTTTRISLFHKASVRIKR